MAFLCPVMAQGLPVHTMDIKPRSWHHPHTSLDSHLISHLLHGTRRREAFNPIPEQPIFSPKGAS